MSGPPIVSGDGVGPAAVAPEHVSEIGATERAVFRLVETIATSDIGRRRGGNLHRSLRAVRFGAPHSRIAAVARLCSVHAIGDAVENAAGQTRIARRRWWRGSPAEEEAGIKNGEPSQPLGRRINQSRARRLPIVPPVTPIVPVWPITPIGPPPAAPRTIPAPITPPISPGQPAIGFGGAYRAACFSCQGGYRVAYCRQPFRNGIRCGVLQRCRMLSRRARCGRKRERDAD